MAGLFDQIINPPPEQGWTFGEKLAGAMLPMVGLLGAAGHRVWREKKDKQAFDAATAPTTDVGKRMLMRARAEGYDSIPAMLTAHQFSMQSADPSNMGNPGNAAMQTASWLSGNGYPEQAVNLAVAAHKALPTSWKPSEGEASGENFQFPNGGPPVTLYDPKAKKEAVAAGAMKVGTIAASLPVKIMTGAELGMSGDAAKDYYAQEYQDQAKTIPAGPPKKLDNATRISINNKNTNDTGLTENQQGQKIERFGRVVDVTEDKLNLFKDIKPLLSNATIGWAGSAVEVTGKVFNLYNAVKTLAEREGNGNAFTEATNSIPIPKSLAGLPVQQQQVLKALVGAAAYAQAREQNSEGEGGGVRNLSATDIKDGYTQLGWGSNAEAMLTVLDRLTRDSLNKMDRAAEDVYDFTGRDVTKYQYKWQRYQRLKKEFGGNTPTPGQPQQESPTKQQDDNLQKWLDKARRTPL